MTAWPWAVLRICCTVTAVLVFDQAVFAGQFLAGSFGALNTHRENATVAGIAVLVTAGAAVLVRLRGGGPRWPAYACLGLFALIAAQIAVGFARLLAVHVPLGVAIIFLTLLLTGWSWRTAPGGRASASKVRAAAAAPDEAVPASRRGVDAAWRLDSALDGTGHRPSEFRGSQSGAAAEGAGTAERPTADSDRTEVAEA